MSLEGIDGSGKTTQAAMLVDALRAGGRDVVATREPGGTELGESLREVLLSRAPGELSPLAEVQLFAAARAQLVHEVIRPALAAGRWVVADRYVDSSLAYQGGGRELGASAVWAVNEPVVAECMPQLTVVVDVPVETAAGRRCASPDRIEAEGEGFQRRVAEVYRRVAAEQPGRVRVVDGDRPIERVHAAVMAEVEALA